MKARIGKGTKSLSNHLAYIEREGAGKDGSKPELLSSDPSPQETKADKHFRLILSPELSRTDLDDLAKRAIQKIEDHIGRKVTWTYAKHFNTEHPHVHLIVSAVVKGRSSITLDQAFLRRGLRNELQDDLTLMYGPRTQESVLKSEERSIKALRLTTLDSTIRAMASNHKIDVETLSAHPKASSLLARCHVLSELGLASKKEQTYYLKPGWDDVLETGRRYSSFVSVRQALMENVRLCKSGEKLAGKIVRIGRIDELSDNHYAVIKTQQGDNVYIPLFYRPHCRKGELVQMDIPLETKGMLKPEFRPYRPPEKDLAR